MHPSMTPAQRSAMRNAQEIARAERIARRQEEALQRTHDRLNAMRANMDAERRHELLVRQALLTRMSEALTSSPELLEQGLSAELMGQLMEQAGRDVPPLQLVEVPPALTFDVEEADDPPEPAQYPQGSARSPASSPAGVQPPLPGATLQLPKLALATHEGAALLAWDTESLPAPQFSSAGSRSSSHFNLAFESESDDGSSPRSGGIIIGASAVWDSPLFEECSEDVKSGVAPAKCVEVTMVGEGCYGQGAADAGTPPLREGRLPLPRMHPRVDGFRNTLKCSLARRFPPTQMDFPYALFDPPWSV